jgi:ribosomal protein S18 acetylase RimI-like enzyme
MSLGAPPAYLTSTERGMGDPRMTDEFDIRTLDRNGIARAIDWAATEGWNPGLGDLAGFASADPGGFFGGWLGGRMIASISVVNYGPSFAFLGFYIVQPAYRGRGFGLRLWRSAMAHAGDRLIGLDGVPDQQENYRRSSFRLAWRNVRFGGRTAPLARASAAGITPLMGVSDDLERVDLQVFPVPRRGFLHHWLTTPGHVALAARRGGEMVGYGVIRPCRNGFKIGPLVAPDAAVASDLAQGLIGASQARGAEVFLDVPEPNTAGTALAAALGLSPVFETARMYTGPAPDLQDGRIFGITSFELG